MKNISLIIVSLVVTIPYALFSGETGSANNTPFSYLKPQTLFQHPLFQQARLAFQTLEDEEKALQASVTNLELSPEQRAVYAEKLQQKQQEREDLFNSTMLAASQQITSSKTETEDVPVALALSQILSGQTVTTKENKNNETEKISGFSWAIRYRYYFNGAAEALQYARDEKEFDTKNTDHMQLLTDVINSYVQRGNNLNSEYQEKITNAKAVECYGMLALLDKLQKNTSAIAQEMEQLITQTKQSRTTLLKEHDEKYNATYSSLEELQTFSKDLPITMDSISLELFEKLQTSVKQLDVVRRKSKNALDDLQICGNLMKGQAQLLTIENNAQ